jgi:ABC-2 type transport system ATP-binding protein
MSAPAIVETRGLTKRYHALTALDDLTLTIEQGAIYGFIGPNGAGKTTTMRILTTLLAPSAGEARVCGYSVTAQAAEARRCLGYMPDTFGVYDDMKVSEYLDFFAACYGVPSQRRAAMIGDLLDLVDLTGKRDAYVATLSRGMQQRLCLARTLVHDPLLLILDEPAAGLDPRARVELRELLKELRALGKTILLSSHILTEMAEVCTHVGILERGVLLTSGRVDEIMRRVQGHRLLAVHALATPAGALAAVTGLPGVVAAAVLTPDGQPLAGAEPPPAPEGATTAGSVDGAARPLTLRLTFDGDEPAMAVLLAALVARGLAVYHFAEERSDLEDIFLRVTTGAVQ